jgi:molybdate transport system substrate-binding protein
MSRRARLPAVAVVAALLALAGALLAGGPRNARRDAPDAAATDAPVIVFAAASLQGALDAVAAAWTRRTGRRATLVYGGSAALARQIDRGAPAQVFVGADRRWLDWLQARGRIDAATRVDLLGNTLVLVAPRADGRPALPSPRGLPAALRPGERIAIADPDTAPAGRYALEALAALGLADALAPRLAPAADVRAALAFVARGEAPYGIVYATDARAEPRVRIVAAFADGHAPIVYPAARTATASPAADAFLAFARGGEAAAIFRTAGFVVPAERR